LWPPPTTTASCFESVVTPAAYVAAARRHRCPLVSGDVAHLVRRGLAVTPDAIGS
jgi:hypothetical protein